MISLNECRKNARPWFGENYYTQETFCGICMTKVKAQLDIPGVVDVLFDSALNTLRPVVYRPTPIPRIPN